MSQINVMLVDDHAVVRMGFKMLLETASATRSPSPMIQRWW